MTDPKYLASAIQMLARIVREYKIRPRAAIEWVASGTMVPVEALVKAWKEYKSVNKSR